MFYEKRLCQTLPRGALDMASRQLDQMIDQARFKHNQQRTRFKDAIDCLDNIFEDFNSNPPTLRRAQAKQQPPATSAKPPVTVPKQRSPPQKNQQPTQSPQKPPPKAESPSSKIEPVQATFTSVRSARAMFEKVAAAGKQPPKHAKQPNTANIGGISSKSEDTNRSQQRGSPQKKPLGVSGGQNLGHTQLAQPQTAQKPPQNGIVHKRNGVANGRRGPKQGDYENCDDIEVTETIVLPSKSTAERLDFTQKWLSDDIRAWANADGAAVAPKRRDRAQRNAADDDADSSLDSDYSLGSCSAEVAAINAKDKSRHVSPQKKSGGAEAASNKKRIQPVVAPPKEICQPSASAVANAAPPIKPQPFRPQPQFPILQLCPSSDQLQLLQNSSAAEEYLRLRASQERAVSQQGSLGSSVHSQDGFRPSLGCGGAFLSTSSLQRTGGGAFVDYALQKCPSGVGSIHSLPDSTLLHPNPPNPNQLTKFSQSQRQPQKGGTSRKLGGRLAPGEDHALAIDALVAELELNTDPASCSAADKRRSFPTTQTEVCVGQTRKAVVNSATNNNVSDQQKPRIVFAGPSSTAEKVRSSPAKPAPNRNNPLATERRTLVGPPAKRTVDTSATRPNTTQQQNRQQQPRDTSPTRMNPPPTTGDHNNPTRKGPANTKERLGGGLNPFQTINKEKLSPSRVDMYSKMFDGGKGNATGPSTVASGGSLQRKVVNTRGGRSGEEAIAKANGIQRVTNANQQQQSSQQRIPVKPPTSQPPPPPAAFRQGGGSASNSAKSLASVNSGGYHSSSSAASRPERLRAPPRDEEDEDDDGFYDNVRKPVHAIADFDLDTDSVSLNSSLHALPPPARKVSNGGAGGRIGQLIRRIGNVGASTKPPMAAASLISLNKVAVDPTTAGMPMRQVRGLVKSNSLSNEPWFEAMTDNGGAAAVASLDQTSAGGKVGGIGNRLKQTLFGAGKKRLQS